MMQKSSKTVNTGFYLVTYRISTYSAITFSVEAVSFFDYRQEMDGYHRGGPRNFATVIEGSGPRSPICEQGRIVPGSNSEPGQERVMPHRGAT